VSTPSHLPPNGGDFRQPNAGQQPWSQPSLPPAKKSGGVWMWVIGGCLGIVLLGGLGFAVLGYFGYKAAQSTIADMEDRPTFAAAKLLVALNSEVELVDADEATQRITVREKSSGKTISITLDELKNGKISFSDQDGKESTLSIEGSEKEGTFSLKTDDGTGSFSIKSGSDVALPSWIPMPEGEITSTSFVASQGTESYVMQLTSTLSADAFADWFTKTAGQQGLEMKNRTIADSGSEKAIILQAESKDGKKSLSVMGSQKSGSGTEGIYTAQSK